MYFNPYYPLNLRSLKKVGYSTVIQKNATKLLDFITLLSKFGNYYYNNVIFTQRFVYFLQFLFIF